MNTNFDKIDEALNIESSIVESKPIKPVPPKVEKDDVKKIMNILEQTYIL
ncbi:MAG: hypothetical protein CM15mV26_0670 [uncultured marine virus]|nr:MAG: hypothetical protein CM15mV26_0670 [uncultured marine virus]